MNQTPYYRQRPTQLYQVRLNFNDAPLVQPEPKPEPTKLMQPTLDPERLRINRDTIENRHTCYQIRQHYARYLAGKGQSALMEDIADRHIKAAFREPDIEKVVDIMAGIWHEFKKR